MQQIAEGSLLWKPTNAIIDNANLTDYMRWLSERQGLLFDGYQELWRWSVEHVDEFWKSLWSYFDLKLSSPWDEVLVGEGMPGVRWFVGAELNYAENIFGRMTREQPVMLFKAENRPIVKIGRKEIYDKSNQLAQALREMGVRRGDRVVAFMPHIPETIIALLAVSSLGAIWSSCSPDFGSRSVLDRFAQIEPKILLAVDGYSYGGKRFDRRSVVADLQKALPTLKKTILIPYIKHSVTGLVDTTLWKDVLDNANAPQKMVFEQVPFDHPLWVLYSSGTTGLPKPIVQGHGGILLEHVKALTFHNDLKPNDRFFWYSSSGWMMWNYTVGALLTGCSIVLYDGSPGYPNMDVLWRLAEESGMTYFGTSAAFISACIKAGIRPNQQFDLSRIRGVGSTGSPLTVDGFQWVYDNVNTQLALESLSGGSDLCTAFVGGVRIRPIHAGEIQGASLGADIQSFAPDGQPIINEVGELVIAKPMPSMPLFFWNDPDNKRYKSSYFEIFPAVWRHGDWIKFNRRGGCVIYGRSDATINRQGIRMGTSEIYRAVESIEAIVDSLVVDLELLGRKSYMPLFVVLRPGAVLDDALKKQIRQKLRRDVSPRHIPDEIVVVKQVPYTLSGKKMEVPVRKILLGQDKNIGRIANPGAMRNPESISFFVKFAQERQSSKFGRDTTNTS